MNFIEQLNRGDIVLPFSVEVNRSFVYNFNFSLKRIEAVDTKGFSILGDILVTRTIGCPESFLNEFCPKDRMNVVLKYDSLSGNIRFVKNPRGLFIRPALSDNGLMNNWWNGLLRCTAELKSALSTHR